jgi:ankyrin repeat protein
MAHGSNANTVTDEVRSAFLEAATWHGNLERAEALLAEHPGLRGSDIRIAAVLGDDEAVRRFIAEDLTSVSARSGPYEADALTYLGLSKYLRLQPDRTPGLLRAAEALLDAGADPNTGFWTKGPHPEYESAIYGAAGVAHHEAMTRLLLSRGANPRDPEVLYHAPETDDLGVIRAVVETGKLLPEDLALMVVRKHDWHDTEGLKYLLEHGADPDVPWGPGNYPMHHGIRRDNGSEMIALLLDHGADPRKVADGMTAIARAAHRGRGDLLRLFRKRGFEWRLEGVDQLIAACAVDDGAMVKKLADEQPRLVTELLGIGNQLIAEFAGTWNTAGVGHLIDLGVPVDARWAGDGYFGTAKDSTALHVASWQGVASTVRLLLARGATVDVKDSRGRTPLMLAVKATVDSHWTHRRTPEAVKALLDAGAPVSGIIPYPSGYDEVDALLRAHGAV